MIMNVAIVVVLFVLTGYLLSRMFLRHVIVWRRRAAIRCVERRKRRDLRRLRRARRLLKGTFGGGGQLSVHVAAPLSFHLPSGELVAREEWPGRARLEISVSEPGRFGNTVALTPEQAQALGAMIRHWLVGTALEGGDG